MTAKQLINLIKKYQPKDIGHVLRLTGLRVKYLGSGSYRHTYNLGDVCVIKFPTTQKGQQAWSLDLAHSRSEWKMSEAIRIAKKGDKFYPLKPHTPKIIFFSYETGVIIAPKYRLLERGDRRINTLRKLVSEITGHKSDDIKYGNVGVNANGDAVILDLGCLEHGE